MKISNSFRQKSEQYVWECILKEWDNSGRNIKLDHRKYTDWDALRRDSRLSVLIQGVRKNS